MDVYVLIAVIFIFVVIPIILYLKDKSLFTGKKRNNAVAKKTVKETSIIILRIKNMPIASQETLDRWRRTLKMAQNVQSAQQAKHLIGMGFRSPPPAMKNIKSHMISEIFEKWRVSNIGSGKKIPDKNWGKEELGLVESGYDHTQNCRIIRTDEHSWAISAINRRDRDR